MKKKTKNQLSGYAFSLPATLLLLTFVVIPIFLTFYYSFTDFNGLQTPQWVGLENFKELFQDKSVVAAMRNTLVFVVVSMPLQVILSLVVAALIAANYRNRFGEFIRGTLFIPVLCSTTLVGTIFSYIFAADPDSLVNTLLAAVGISKINLLGSTESALGVIIFVFIWKNLGYYMVIFYAGIMDISNELYEASSIDGATKTQQFFRITIPSLRPVLLTVITVCTIWSFQAFDLAYTMTLGGPGYATTTLVFELYQNAFKDFDFGYASAIAVLLFMFVLIFNLIQRMIAKDEED